MTWVFIQLILSGSLLFNDLRIRLGHAYTLLLRRDSHYFCWSRHRVTHHWGTLFYQDWNFIWQCINNLWNFGQNDFIFLCYLRGEWLLENHFQFFRFDLISPHNSVIYGVVNCLDGIHILADISNYGLYLLAGLKHCFS